MRIVRFLAAGLRRSGLAKPSWLGVLLLALTPATAVAQLGGIIEFTSELYGAAETDGQAIITVTRNTEYGAVEVDVVVTDGTAVSGVDYEVAAVTNTLVFNHLQTSAQLVVDILDNTDTNELGGVELNLALQDPRSLDDPQFTPELLGKSAATLTIFDNDGQLQFNFGQFHHTVNEGGSVDIRVVLAAPVTAEDQGVEVDYEVGALPPFQTMAGSDYASGGLDFTNMVGTLTFAEGESEKVITVQTVADDLVEFNEDILVVLTAARGVRTIQAAGTDGGTDAGGGAVAAATDGGGGGGEPTEIEWATGPVNAAIVTILFNGDVDHPQPAGAVDREFNADNDPDTVPALNRSPGANNTVYAVATTADGKTIIGGDFTSVNTFGLNRIARLDTNGLVDLTFAPSTGANDFVSGVAVYTNGPLMGRVLMVGGFTAVNSVLRNGIARLNVDGSIDNSFNVGLGANGPIYAVALQRDGRVLIGGDFTSFNGVPLNRVARLNPDGGVDLTFDPGSGADGPVFSVFAESSAPVVVHDGITNGVAGLYTREIDAGATSGTLSLDFSFFAATNDLTVLYEGQPIYMSGLTNHIILTPDPTNANVMITNFYSTQTNINFQGSSTLLTIVINTQTNANSNWVYTASIQGNTAVGALIGGDFAQVDNVQAGRVARLAGNGAVDADFAANAGLGADDIVYAVSRQRNGQVILGGAFRQFNSFPAGGIARLNSNGTLDDTFAAGSGANGIVYTVEVDREDRILVGGSFDLFNGTRRLMLTRLMTNGPVDTSFMDSAYNQYAGFPAPGGGFPNGEINSIALTMDGDVVVGGTFTQVGGGTTRTDIRPRNNVARLHGAEDTPGPGNVTLTENLFGGDENGVQLSFLSARENGTLGAVDLSFFTQEGGATEGEDYTGYPDGGVVEWAIVGPMQSDGNAATTATPVDLIDDTLIEGDEDFKVNLLQAKGWMTLGGEYILPGAALGAISEATALILENDVETSELRFSSSEYDFNENDGTVTIEVHRTGSTSRAVSVRYGLGEFTGTNPAVINEDFLPFSGTLSFASGQTNRTFTVRLRDDEVVEPDETLLLQLVQPSPGVTLGTNAVAALNIIDNDYAPGRVSLSATNYTVLEGGMAEVIVKRTGGNVGVLQVDYTTLDGSAMAPFDYLPVSGRLTWNDRESSARTITIPIEENGFVSGNREFSLRLSNPNPSGGLGLRTNATVTIVDNDAFGSFSFNAEEFLADENGTNVIVNVIRRGGSAETATVQYSTTNNTAIAGEDYVAVSGTLTFGVGETSQSFLVPLIDNSEVDGERSIGLVLSAPSPAGAGLGPLTNASIAIIDNESFNIPAGSPETDLALGNGANDSVHAIGLQSDGRVVIGGDFTVVNSQVRNHIARLTSDGNVDLSFGAGLELNGSVRDLSVQSDGRIVVAGSFTEINGLPANYLARFSASGLVDGTFNVGAGADNPIFAVETFETTNGVRKVLIGGSFSMFNGVQRRGIAQVNADGRTDRTFGEVRSGVNGTVYAIARQRDGKILIGGEFVSVGESPRQNIARLNADGSLDDTFDPGLGADGSVRSIIVQYDDRIVIGGLFETVSGVARSGIARLNPDGTLDSSFNPGDGANGAVYALALQLDGKILAGGEFTVFQGVPSRRIVRLNPNGSLDTSINFGQGANGFVGAIAVQPNRRIWLGGGFTEFDRLPHNHYTRLYGGSVGGVGELGFAQADFRILENETNAVVTVRRSGGLLGTVSVEYSTQARTAEPNADYLEVSGVLVFGPGENEKQFEVPMVDDFAAEPDEIVDLALRNATGGATLIRQPIATLTIVSDDSVIGFAEALYTVSESAAGGTAVITVRREGELSFPASIIYQTLADGTASSGSDFTPVSGILDFGPGQAVRVFTVPILEDSVVEENETVTLELIPVDVNQPVGRVRAVLTILDNDFAPGILSLVQPPQVSEGGGTVTITVSRSSGRTGTVTVNYTILDGTAIGGLDYVRSSSVVTFNEGETIKSIIVPILQDSLVEGTEFFIVQLSNPTGGAVISGGSVAVNIVDDDFGPGSFDTSFSVGAGTDGPVYSMELQPDGKILLSGGFSSFDNQFSPGVARVLPSGLPDLASFSPGAGLNGTGYAVRLQQDGKVAVGGDFTSFGGISRPFVARFLTNGLPDVNLNRSAGENAVVRSIAPQADGKLILGGEFTTPARGVIRITQDGALDPSFNPTGGANGNVYRVRLQSDGRVLVGGEFTQFGTQVAGSLVRLLTNGLTDASFAIGTGVNGRVNAITIAPGGKILVGGDFTSINGVGRTRIARLNADGSVDLTFVPEMAPNGPVNDIAVFLDKIYIVGDFSQVGSTNRNRIARLNSDGSLDLEFNAGLGADGPVHAVSVQADGQILIAGDFFTVNGFTSPGVARLNGDQGGAPNDVQIQSARAEAGEMVLTYSTQPGRTYVIEGSSDLSTWETLESAVATGTSAEYREAANEQFRFFRIRIE